MFSSSHVPKSDYRSAAGLKFYSFVPWCHATFDLTSAYLSAPFTSCPPFPPCPHPSLPLSLYPYLSQAKVDNEIIDYRDLAAIPRVKAIYDIEHPDMISYKCTNGNSSTLDNKSNRQERQSPAEVTSCTTMQVHTFNPVVVVWLVALHQARPARCCKQIIHVQANRTLSHSSFRTWKNVFLLSEVFFSFI